MSPTTGDDASATARPQREILVFEVGERTYGLPTSAVRELVRAVAITPLSNGPAAIEGVVNVRGRILPVVNVRARFGLPPRALDPADHFIIAAVGTRGLILRVDRATHLALVDEAAILPMDDGTPDYIPGVAGLDGGLVLIHDLASFLTAAESATVDATLEGH